MDSFGDLSCLQINEIKFERQKIEDKESDVVNIKDSVVSNIPSQKIKSGEGFLDKVTKTARTAFSYDFSSVNQSVNLPLLAASET